MSFGEKSSYPLDAFALLVVISKHLAPGYSPLMVSATPRPPDSECSVSSHAHVSGIFRHGLLSLKLSLPCPVCFPLSTTSPIILKIPPLKSVACIMDIPAPKCSPQEWNKEKRGRKINEALDLFLIFLSGTKGKTETRPRFLRNMLPPRGCPRLP